MGVGRLGELVERLLDRAGEAAGSGRWEEVAELCERVLAVEPDNADALAMLDMARPSERGRPQSPEPAPTGERRVVTALFADAVGFTALSSALDEEDVYRMVQRCVALMANAVDRHGGRVTQFRGDGVMALFGAPIAQEQAAVAAVAAALEMQAELSSLAAEMRSELGVGPAFRIGLNTGGVVVGSVSDDASVDYTALGDTVNLAARMEQLADPGAVFLTERTYRSVAGYVECEDLGPRPVKGKARDIHVYRAMRVLHTAGRVEAESRRGLSEFVGRDVEIGLLAGLCERAARGRAQAVEIAADAGIGKSRLVYELSRQPRLAGLQWCFCWCSAERQASPFGVLADLIRWASAHGKPHELATDDRPFVELLLGDGGADHRAIDTLDPRDRQRRTIDAAVSLLGACCDEVPLVAVIEDAHWIDDATGLALGQLVERLAERAFALIVTARPGYETVPGGRARMTRVMLDPLDPGEIAQLVAGCAGGALAPEGVAAVCGRSEGNPFFAEELVKSLLELDANDTRSGGPDAIPDTVHGVVLARIDRLPGGARRALQVASVIGREVDRELLDGVLEGDGLAEALDLLTAAELLIPSAVDPSRRLAFKHALIRDVAYSSLLRSKRRELHAAVARQLRKTVESDAGGLESELAAHYESAEDWAAAASALTVAADRAAGTGAVDTALDLLARAIAHGERAGDHAQVSACAQRRANLGFITARFDIAGAEWQRVEELARIGGDEALRVIALAQLGVIAVFAHDRTAADAATAQAVRLVEDVDDAEAHATALGARLWFCVVAGQLEQLKPLTLAYERRARGASAQAQATWRVTQSLVSRWQGSIEQTLALTESDAGSIRTGGRTAALARQGWIRVMALTEAGRFEDALDLGLRVVIDAEHLGEMLWRARLLNTIGWLHHEMLDPSGALEWNERSLDHARALPAPDAEIASNAHLNLAENYLSLGRDTDAAAHLATVQQLIEQPGPRDWFVLWRFTLRCLEIAGRLALRRGDAPATLELADSCWELAARSASRKYLVKASRLKARASLQTGDLTGARSAATTSVAESRTLGGPGQIWRSLAVAAMVHDAEDEPSEARACRTEAIALLEKLASGLAEPRRSTMDSSTTLNELRRQNK